MHDFLGVDEQCLDRVRFQFGSGAGAPTERAEAEGDDFKVVRPFGSFPCGDLEKEQQRCVPFGALTVPMGNGARYPLGRAVSSVAARRHGTPREARK